MQNVQIELQPLEPDHLDVALRLSRAAGWPHRREDWAALLALGSGAVAVEAGQVIGTAFLTRYGDEIATVSGVMVEQALRGRGIGRRLLEWALEAAGDRECRLVATAEGLPLYRRFGFREVGEVRQHQGLLQASEISAGATWVGVEAAPSFAHLDRLAFGADRGKLIAMLFADGKVAALPDGNGFTALRGFGRGALAGPVVARTLAEAQALLGFLFAGRAGTFMRVDTASSELVGWLEAHGLLCVDIGVEMRLRTRTRASQDWRRFALASQGLG